MHRLLQGLIGPIVLLYSRSGASSDSTTLSATRLKSAEVLWFLEEGSMIGEGAGFADEILFS
jgi:hypothetical protein